MPIEARVQNAVIPNAGTQSAARAIVRAHNIALWMPSAWTAANLGVQLARTGAAPGAGDWFDLTDDSAVVTLPAAASRVIVLPASLMIPNGARWFRLVSSVAQGAERTIEVEFREIS